MTAATLTAPPVITPPLPLADLLQGLEDGIDYRDGLALDCGECRRAAIGVCRTHDDDSRLAHSYADLRRRFEAAAEAISHGDPGPALALVAALAGAE